MLAYQLLTEEIIGAVYEVHSQLGPGFLEKPYQNALALALRKRGLSIEKEKGFDVLFDGVSVGYYYADLVVEDTVIIEVKAVQDLNKEMMCQTVNYLAVSGLPVALLVNFRNSSAVYRRFDNRFLK